MTNERIDVLAVLRVHGGLDDVAAAVAELIETLRSAREWHLCDKWRFGDDEQRGSWQSQLDRYDAAIARFQPDKWGDEMKIWQINDMEWWIGEGTPESILAAYMEEYGVSHEDATGDEDEFPYELSDGALDGLKFQDCDEDERPTGIVRTFREQMDVEIERGGKFPRLFAASE